MNLSITLLSFFAALALLPSISHVQDVGGGLSIYITNIRELPDGRITFYIGYEFQ